MAKGSTFRVARTAAQFTTMLGRILREELKLKITEHEQWEFEHVADWEKKVLGEPWRTEFEMSRYWGIGAFSTRRDGPIEKTKVRVMIEKQCWTALGYKDHFPFIVHIWIRFQDGTTLIKSYVAWNDSEMLYTAEGKAPRLPRRMEFERRKPVNPGGADSLVSVA